MNKTLPSLALATDPLGEKTHGGADTPLAPDISRAGLPIANSEGESLAARTGSLVHHAMAPEIRLENHWTTP